MDALNQVLQIASASLVAFTTLALTKSLRHGRNLWAATGLTLSVFCYLVVDEPGVQGALLRPLVVTGSTFIPVFFWLLSRSIFEDHFHFKPNMLVWFLVQTAPHIHHYLKGILVVSRPVHMALDILSQVISLVFVFSGIYVALRTQSSDLIESRRKFRKSFVILNAVLIGLTVIIESTPLAQESTNLLQILQRSSILGLTGYFLLTNFVFQSGFFFQEVPKLKPAVVPDIALEDQLTQLLTGQKIYRQEGLTIGQLADLMKVQEHRLRKLINGQMGFKNFNDFLNQFRVQEACEILANPAENKKTILEIGYAMGYQSIGPFNKAFREQKNTTPTAFRKESQAQNSG
jgi:AraC-like DNA-binding protein